MSQNSSQSKTITKEEAESLIRNKHTFYTAMISNGWLLPEEKSPIVTVNFMQDVKAGRTFCISMDHFTKVPCPNPPPIDVLSDTLVKMILEAEHYPNEATKAKCFSLARYLGKYRADKPWLLLVLGTLNKDLPIFKKGYMPPPQSRRGSKLTKVAVDNSDDFFTGLPVLSQGQMKKRGNSALFLTPEERLTARVEAL